jgi:hypothetical protein
MIDPHHRSGPAGQKGLPSACSGRIEAVFSYPAGADSPMPILQPAVLYFLLVFGAGFILGTVRVLFLVPLLGDTAAELVEMPLMLGIIAASARWIVRHGLGEGRRSSALAVGFIALGMVLIADLAVGILLRGMSAAEVFLHRDAVTGTAYYISLLLFAAMPSIVVRLQLA